MPEYLQVAERAVREAGALLREGYGQAMTISFKGAIDLVTDYDRRSEALILDRLRAAFPGHALLAEESGRAAGSDHEWLVDPLDGTTNFAHAFPVFAVSVALAYRRRLVAGVVYDPLRDELFAAEAGQGATLNGARLKVSTTAQLDQALLSTGFPYDVRTNPHSNVEEFTRFLKRAQAIRRAGSAALDLCYLACGRFDAYWEWKLSPWDSAAGVLIVREAGGTVSNFAGGAFDLYGTEVLASNRLLHQVMIDVLAQRP